MLLLDTHVLYWLLFESETLSAERRALLKSSRIYVSKISLWEFAIKKGLGKLKIPEDFFKTFETAPLNYILLDIACRHLEMYQTLPLHHRDPFDRMLIAQAMAEELTLVTNDTALQRYPVKIMAV